MKKNKGQIMNQKKEYVAPEMDVIECVVKTSLLEGSPDTSDVPEVQNTELD